MEKIRLDASAYYRSLTPAGKRWAQDGFDAMDKTGSGKVSLKQYSEFFKQRGLVELTYPDLFKALDTNGDGTLDFDEYITVYYLCMNNKLIFCEACGVFLSGSYMSCHQCFKYGSGDPYNICYDCYSRNKFDHHRDAYFVDSQKLQSAANKASAVKKGTAVNNGSTTRSSCGKITTEDKLRAAILGVSMVKLGIKTGIAANTASNFEDHGSNFADVASNVLDFADVASNVLDFADVASNVLDFADVAEHLVTAAEIASNCSVM